MRAHLYPPARMLDVGHFVCAKVKSLPISAMAAGLEPAGIAFSGIPAVYGPPTPWIQTCPCPSWFVKVFATVGPTEAPYTYGDDDPHCQQDSIPGH